MKKANEALTYVRRHIEEFKPDTAKLLLGALRQRVPEPPPRRLSDVGALVLRAETAEGALRAMATQATQATSGPEVAEAARALIHKIQEALPPQRYDEPLKWHDVRMAIDDLELALHKEE